MRVRGKDVALYAGLEGEGGVLLGLSKSCSLQVNCDMKEFSSVLSGRAKRMRPGRYGWSVDTEVVTDDTDPSGITFLRAIREGKSMTVAMSIEVPGSATTKRFYGAAYVQAWKLTGAIGSMSTYTVTLTGDGDLLNS